MKNSKTTKKELTELSKKIKELIIELAYKSHSGEVGSALCISDIIATLYFRVMNVDPKNPEDLSKDHFILSKGHGASALYITLALKGYFPKKLLQGYRIDGGTLHLHPCSSVAPGVEVSTGALGHGLPIAAGMALGLKTSHPKSKVFVLVGDGECNEGSNWEAVMFASTHNLSNLITIVDNNGFQGFGETKVVHSIDLGKAFKSFGWQVLKANGHDLGDLEKVMSQAKEAKKPTVIIADTVNGKGIPEIENTLKAHYYSPDHKVYRNRKKIN
jgi:transketolase